MNYLKVAILLSGVALIGGGIFSLSKRNASPFSIFSYSTLYPQYLTVTIGLLLICIGSYVNISGVGILEGMENEKSENNNEKSKTFTENNPMQSLEPEHPRAELVLFYAIWCGYSKQFLPEWRKFVEEAKREFPDLKLTEVRCEGDNENFCGEVGVEGYPTVVLYINDKQYMFNSERTTEKLKEFVADKL